MKLRHMIQVVDSHTCGHPTRLVLGGLPRLRGRTVRDKKEEFATRYDHLRGTLLHEPRGHFAMFAAILCEPGDPEADAGLIFVSSYKYLNMCGHATIGAVTCLAELGILEGGTPQANFRIEVPAGTINVRTTINDGDVGAVSFDNVPSYVWERDLKVAHDHEPFRVDVAYSGLWYMLVKAEDLGYEFQPEKLRQAMERADALKQTVNASLEERRLRGERTPTVDSALVYQHYPEQRKTKNVVVVARYKYDRSPCGTGSSSLAALLSEQGFLGAGESFVSEGILGTSFQVRNRGAVDVEGRAAIIPEVTGSAHITGFGQLIVDERDPLKGGFLLG